MRIDQYETSTIENETLFPAAFGNQTKNVRGTDLKNLTNKTADAAVESYVAQHKEELPAQKARPAPKGLRAIPARPDHAEQPGRLGQPARRDQGDILVRPGQPARKGRPARRGVAGHLPEP